MVAKAYVPDVGEFVWLNFMPQAGREQAGRRPALVLSPRTYNDKASLAVVCPITSRAQGYPFDVALPKGLMIAGVVLADHLKSVDWREGRGEQRAAVSTCAPVTNSATPSSLLWFASKPSPGFPPV